MTELNVRIEQVRNGFTIHVTYTDANGDYTYYDLIAGSYKEALSLVADIGD